jgi:positive regulator of sigma E activity
MEVIFMPKFQVVSRHSNAGLLFLAVVVYVTLLFYFAWQTILFTGIIFPDADIQMKILTVFSVDGMGFVWANLHTFYRFAHPGSKTAVKWGWGVTYALSALLSVLYLVFTFVLNFSHITDMITIKTGVVLSIAALMFNIAALSFFLYLEIATRFPREDEYEIVNGNKNSQQQQQLLTTGNKNSLDTDQLDAAILSKKKVN